MKEKITINLEFGSDYQQEIYMTVLRATMLAIELRMIETHKWNKIKVLYSSDKQWKTPTQKQR